MSGGNRGEWLGRKEAPLSAGACRTLSVVLLVFISTSEPSMALEDYYWKTAASGAINDPNNWSPTGVPGPSDRANFDQASSGYTVSLPTGVNVSLSYIVVGRPLFFGEQPNSHNEHLAIDLGGQTLTTSGTIGVRGGELTVRNGTLTMPGGAQSVIGGYGNAAAMTVTDGATLKMSGGDIYLADGVGNMFTLDGAGTTASLSDAGIWMQSGSQFRVLNGAALTSSRSRVLINDPYVNGAALVDGSGSQWTIDGGQTLYVDSQGSLSVTNGGIVTAARPAVVLQGGGIDVGTGSTYQGAITAYGSLHVDGAINGIINTFGYLSGDGQIRAALHAQAGATINPGNGLGELAVNVLGLYGGSTIKLHINAANGTAGGTSGWDLLTVSQFAALLGSPDKPMVIAPQSLTTQNTPGAVADFDPSHEYHWTFLTAANVFNFNPEAFSVDTSGFANPVSGHFRVSQVDNTLVLDYLVPEPGALAGGMLGFAALLLVWRRLAV